MDQLDTESVRLALISFKQYRDSVASNPFIRPLESQASDLLPGTSNKSGISGTTHRPVQPNLLRCTAAQPHLSQEL